MLNQYNTHFIQTLVLIYPDIELINKILSNFTKIANNKNGIIVLKKIIILTKNNNYLKYIT